MNSFHNLHICIYYKIPTLYQFFPKFFTVVFRSVTTVIRFDFLTKPPRGTTSLMSKRLLHTVLYFWTSSQTLAANLQI